MKRAVIDTTVLISAFLTEEGVSAKLLEEARGGAFVVCLSAEIIEEMRRRLLEPSRMRVRYDYSDEQVETQCRDLALTAELISDLPDVHAVDRDPNDDMIVATALKAKADCLVTRDKDLLSLGVYEEILIVTPEAFMGMLREERKE
jgi:putative PIN family toxin of toxin-antitoxin system